MDLSIFVSAVLTGSLYALTALGLSLAFGVMKIINMAHGEFIVGGGYVASVLVVLLGVDPLLALVVVVPVTAAVAYAIQRLLITGLMSKGQEPPLVATYGVGLLISAILVQTFGGEARSIKADWAYWGVSFAGVNVRFSDILNLAFAVAIIVGLHVVMTRTTFGAALRAASEDAATAGLMGIRVKHIYAVTLSIAAAIAAVSGTLIGVGYSLTPTSGTTYLLVAFAVIVLARPGNIFDALWGGIVIALAQSVGGAVLGGQYRDFVLYAVLVILLMARPLLGDVVSTVRARRTTRAALGEQVSA